MPLRPVLTVFTVLAATIGCTVATAATPYSPVEWTLRAGFNQPVGPTNELLQGGGYVIGAGIGLVPEPGAPLSLRFDVDFNDNRATRQVIDSGAQQLDTYVFDGSVWSTAVTANAVYRVPFGAGVRGYLIGGVGVYYTQVDLNQGGDGGGYCNPFWGYCVGYGPSYASQSTTKFGWDAGLGVEFPLRYGQAWFIEARFNRIETAQPLEYIPITVGFRF